MEHQTEEPGSPPENGVRRINTVHVGLLHIFQIRTTGVEVKKLIIAGVLIFIQLPVFAFGEDWSTGNKWYETCTSSDSKLKSLCVTLVAGMSLGSEVQAALTNTDKLLCLPNKVTNGQATDILAKYLINNPGKRHLDISILFFTAMGQAFPCPK